MPFVMTHLQIAYKILNSTPQIKKPGEFMLGALAPDAVHFRDNYNSDMKKRSHLCVGNEKWGRLTNNHEWLENVLSFLQENKQADNADFIYGYCSHILADIQNNIKIWTPFMIENIEALEKGLGNVYHQEASNIDYEQYISHPEQKAIWETLEKAVGYDISNVIGSSEINEMKNSVLHSRFMNREHADVASNKYVTISGMEEFVSMESRYIKELLYPGD